MLRWPEPQNQLQAGATRHVLSYSALFSSSPALSYPLELRCISTVLCRSDEELPKKVMHEYGGSAMLCYAMLCYAMLCYAMLCYAMLCYAMLCYAMLCYAMLCYAMLCYVSHKSIQTVSCHLFTESMLVQRTLTSSLLCCTSSRSFLLSTLLRWHSSASLALPSAPYPPLWRCSLDTTHSLSMG
jgi:hypothetical protein